MPLGLMPRMSYEENETSLAEGESVLFYSDGLVEAHDPRREMFGFPRLRELVCEYGSDGGSLVERLLDELAGFVGPDLGQEDDITLVVLQRLRTT
jgi:serine phosphatase RsbU (regulator of sigma subunit)